MRKLLTILYAILCLSAMTAAQTTSEIKITTSKEYGDNFDMWPKTSSIDDPIVVDWGDGELKTYNIDPNESGYFAKVSGRIVGDTIRIFSQLTSLDCSEGQVTSLYLIGQDQLTHLIAYGNELTYGNFDFTGALNLTNVDVNSNQINLMDMRSFEKLQFFSAYDNPGLTTVLFPDSCETLEQITLSNCDISNFYPVYLPNLSLLTLSNNALMELETGDYYPNLSTLSIDGNYLQQIDLSQCPELTQLNIEKNFISSLNLTHNPKLTGIFCSRNQLKELDLSGNPEITRISCANNNITHLDVSKQLKLMTLNCDSNRIERLNLKQNSFLREIYCKANLLEFLDFSGNNQLEKVDCRYNSRMTACAVNYMFGTMWGLWEEQYFTNLFLEGCNAEGADASTITSSDYKWKIDITCDGSAECENVNITVLPAQNGTFYLEQATADGLSYNKITETAKIGTPIRVVATPDEQFALAGVKVNDSLITDSLFLVHENSSIEAVFSSTLDPYILLEVEANHEMSFALASAEPTTITIDWGNGEAKEYSIKDTWTRIDEVSAGTQIKITGDVTAANFESYPGMGLWDNQITGIDVTNNNLLVWLSTYMNPIDTLDLSNCPDLTNLDCAYSDLSQLDISKATGLTHLICYGNQLTQLDVSKNNALLELNAKNNLLEDIDLSNNSLLETLDLQQNKLKAVNTSHMSGLKILSLSGNLLDSINLGKNTQLTELSLNENNLKSIDLSENTQLIRFQCSSNQISGLDFSNNTKLQYVNCEDNMMSACALNDMYYSLPEFKSDEPVDGFTLWVKGTSDKANDAEHAESILATGKGWKPNYEGDGSGCEEAYLTIKETENGSVQVFDADNHEVKSGEKMTKGKTYTVKANPEEGYQVSSMKANGVELNKYGEFTPTRATDIVVKFEQENPDVANEGDNGIDLTIYTHDHTLCIEAGEQTDILVYNILGRMVYRSSKATSVRVELPSGLYLIQSIQSGRTDTRKVVVR